LSKQPPQINCDHGLDRVGGFKELGRIKLDDTALSHLSGLTKQRDLSLNQTAITDAGIRLRARLCACAVNDAGLKLPQGMPALESLTLHESQGLDALGKARPDLRLEN
jgi:hypothetical protein